MSSWQKRMQEAVRSGDPDALALVNHGTRTGYTYGCRCDECREAARAAVRAWREANRPAKGPKYSPERKAEALRLYQEHGPKVASRRTGILAETIRSWASKEGVQYRTELQPCGTRAAYLRHLHHGETPCEACVVANRESTYARRADLRQRAAKGDIDIPHGTRVGYSYRGCRCGPCTEANRRQCAPYGRAYRERQKAKRVSA